MAFDVKRFWLILGSFWDQFDYDDKVLIEHIWNQYLQVVSDSALSLYQADLSKSLKYLPAILKHKNQRFDIFFASGLQDKTTVTISGLENFYVDEGTTFIPTLSGITFDSSTYPGEVISQTIDAASPQDYKIHDWHRIAFSGVSSTLPTFNSGLINSGAHYFAPVAYQINPALTDFYGKSVGFKNREWQNYCDYQPLVTGLTISGAFQYLTNKYEHLKNLTWGIWQDLAGPVGISGIQNAAEKAKGVPFTHESGIIAAVSGINNNMQASGTYISISGNSGLKEYILPPGMSTDLTVDAVVSGFRSLASSQISGCTLANCSGTGVTTGDPSPLHMVSGWNQNFLRSKALIVESDTLDPLPHSSSFYETTLSGIVPANIEYKRTPFNEYSAKLTGAGVNASGYFYRNTSLNKAVVNSGTVVGASGIFFASGTWGSGLNPSGMIATGLNTKFSLSTWAKPNLLTTTGVLASLSTLYSSDTNGTDRAEYYLALISGASNDGTAYIRLGQANHVLKATGLATSTVSGWHHYLLTHDRSLAFQAQKESYYRATSSGNTRIPDADDTFAGNSSQRKGAIESGLLAGTALYIDGQKQSLVASIPTSGMLSEALLVSGVDSDTGHFRDFRVGAGGPALASTPAATSVAKIDITDLSIWNHVFTSGELGAFTRDSLVGHYPLDLNIVLKNKKHSFSEFTQGSYLGSGVYATGFYNKLAGYWNFNESSGGTVYDQTYNQDNLVYATGISNDNNLYSTSISLRDADFKTVTGLHEIYSTTASGFGEGTNTTFSINYWAKWNNLGGDNNNEWIYSATGTHSFSPVVTISGKQDDLTPSWISAGFGWRESSGNYYTIPAVQASGNIAGGLYTQKTPSTFLEASKITQDVWSMYTYTYNKASNDLYFYKDGVFIGERTLSSFVLENVEAVYIGALMNASGFTPEINVKDVSVYQNVLPSGEVYHLYNKLNGAPSNLLASGSFPASSTTSPFYSGQNLVCWYRLGDHVGGTADHFVKDYGYVYDRSNYRNHALMSGVVEYEKDSPAAAPEYRYGADNSFGDGIK